MMPGPWPIWGSTGWCCPTMGPPTRSRAGSIPFASLGGKGTRRHVEILLDTGIMSGADIVAAIALGARFTLVGRAYLYGLMAGGEAGVDRGD